MDFQFHWSPEAFLDTLPIMGYGMLGIFGVMLILYVAIVLLTKIFGERRPKGENQEGPNR